MTATAPHTVRCPMIECQRRVDLDVLPVPPEQPLTAPCLHYIAAWGGRRGGMAEAVLWGLRGNRELTIRNLRPAEVDAARIGAVRAELEAAARRFAHEAEGTAGETALFGALFGDVHERNRVAFEFARLLLGPDPMAEGGSR